MAIKVSGTTVIDDNRNFDAANTYITGETQVREVREVGASTGSTSGTLTINADTGAVVRATSNQTGNRTCNITASTSYASLNAKLTTNESYTCAVILPMGGTAYYINSVQVDGSAVTPKWVGGAPTEGTASADNVYSFTVIKTGDGAFKVLASLTAFE